MQRNDIIISKSTKLTCLLLIAQLTLSVTDLYTIPGTLIAQLNVIFILASFFLGKPSFPYILAFIATFFGILDLVIPPHDEFAPTFVIYMRRGISFLNFWIVAYVTHLLIVYKNKQLLLVKSLELEKAKVQRSNKELEHFAAVAAHDLRSPLLSMIGWTELLEDEAEKKSLSSTAQQALHFLKTSAAKCTELVSDLLELARVNSNVAMETVDLNHVVQSVLENNQTEIESSHAKVVVGKLPIIYGNTSQLDSLFTNLIRNAILYCDKMRTPIIEISSSEALENYQISVKDNGIGIEPSQTTAIFEMFKRLHSNAERPGTGIGLALCRKIVDLMDGKIWVESTPGEGSRFFIVIPKRLHVKN